MSIGGSLNLLRPEAGGRLLGEEDYEPLGGRVGWGLSPQEDPLWAWMMS